MKLAVGIHSPIMNTNNGELWCVQFLVLLLRKTLWILQVKTTKYQAPCSSLQPRYSTWMFLSKIFWPTWLMLCSMSIQERSGESENFRLLYCLWGTERQFSLFKVVQWQSYSRGDLLKPAKNWDGPLSNSTPSINHSMSAKLPRHHNFELSIWSWSRSWSMVINQWSTVKDHG